MLDLTGGDTATLAEITDAQSAVLAQPSPDLPLMARLAVHRQRIAGRNSNIPTHLPAIWVRLGHTTRAEQLARSITNPFSQARALADVAGALARAGEQARAEQLARGITEPFFQARALADVAGALTRAGEQARAEQVAADAEQLARSITNPDHQARALAGIAGALSTAGNRVWAVRLLGAALGVGHWTYLPLSIVADVSPNALHVIANATAGNQEG